MLDAGSVSSGIPGNEFFPDEMRTKKRPFAGGAGTYEG